MSDDKKIIFSMYKVSKTYPPSKTVIKDISLSFYLGAKIGIKGKLKAAITGSVELKESDIKELLWELELSLLEADVEQTTAEDICKEIKERLDYPGDKFPFEAKRLIRKRLV